MSHGDMIKIEHETDIQTWKQVSHALSSWILEHMDDVDTLEVLYFLEVIEGKIDVAEE